MTVPLLSLIVWTPFATALALSLVRDEHWARRVAIAASALELLLTVAAVAAVSPASGDMQLVERAAWMPTIQAQYLLGVDGLSVLFLPLTALLFTGVIVAGWTPGRAMPRLYYGLLLVLEGCTLGVYTALDLILFFVFWELTIVPVFFLVTLWGIGAERRYAGVKYALVMLAGGVPLLFGILTAALAHADAIGLAPPLGLSFDYFELVRTPPLPGTQQVVFLLLFLGFAVKMPLPPFHTWLPTVAMEGPAGVTAVLVGLKVGVYGLLRFAAPLAPAAVTEWAGVGAAFGAVAMVYGALVALSQSNLRHVLAYASISHVGMVLVGLSALNVAGVQGAVLLALNFPLSAAGLMLLAGALHRRLGSTDLGSLGGLAVPLPRLAALFFVLAVGSIGLPGTSGFVAEYLIVAGALGPHPGAALAVVAGLVLGAAYVVRAYRQTFLGRHRRESAPRAPDLQPRELVVAGTLAALVVLGGLWPQPALTMTARAAVAWVGQAVPAPSTSLRGQ